MIEHMKDNLNSKHRLIFGKCSTFYLIFPVVGLLVMSVWSLLECGLADSVRTNGGLNVYQIMAIKQGVAGLFALGFAWCIARFSLHKYIFRYWYAFPVILVGFMMLDPVVDNLDIGKRIAVGDIYSSFITGMYYVSLIVTQVFLASRLRLGVVKAAFLLGVMFIITVIACVVLSNPAMLILFFCTPVVALFAAKMPWTRYQVLVTEILIFYIGFAMYVFANTPTRMQMIVDWSKIFEAIYSNPVYLSKLDINGGGAFGSIAAPLNTMDSYSRFVFGSICHHGGFLSGCVVLLLTGIFIYVIWEVVAFQKCFEKKVVSAGCATILTVSPILGIAVNLGHFPDLHSYNYPILSYDPVLLLFHGLLLGVLYALRKDGSCEAHDKGLCQLYNFDSECCREQSKVNLALFDRWKISHWVASITRVKVVVAIFLILISLFGVKTAKIVFGKSLYSAETKMALKDRESMRERNRKLTKRGRILSCKEEQLAWSVQGYNICFDVATFRAIRVAEDFERIAAVLNMELSEVKSRALKSGERYTLLKKGCDPDFVEKVMALNLRDIFTEEVWLRKYTESMPLGHLAGVVGGGVESQGLSGVEHSYDRILSSGRDVRLTLDSDLQTRIHSVAVSAKKSTQAKQVHIIVLNPSTGAILAGVQLPCVSGGVKRTSEDISALSWRPIVDVCQPGALIRPLVVASALALGVIEENSLIDCSGSGWSHENIMVNRECLAKMFPMNIIASSSRTGMANIGDMVGGIKLHSSLMEWGLGRSCSVGFTGATDGLLRDPKRWTNSDPAYISIGHGGSFSIMQIARAYTAIYNGGIMVEPHLVEAIAIRSGEVWVKRRAPKPERVMKENTAEYIYDSLKLCVEEGAGRQAKVDGVSVAGKSAVVQKVINDRYCRVKHQSSFIGGFELSGCSYMVVVWLDEPQSHLPNPAPYVFKLVAEEIIKTKADPLSGTATILSSCDIRNHFF